MKNLLSLCATAALSALLGSAALAEGSLYFGLSGEPRTLDTKVNAGAPARTIRLAIHRGLLNYGTTGELSPELAESFEVSADALSYTFRLREAKFHDGTPVTAADVKATLDYLTAEASTATYKAELSVIDTIATPDERTVVITLKKPFVPFPHYLALPESAILPASWIAANAETPDAAPIGAGPFRFVTWERGREVVVEKFDGYYKPGKPAVDEIHYVFYGDENTRVNAIRSGDVDIIDYVPWKDAAALEQDPAITLDSVGGPFMMLQFNTKEGPFADPRVRQAVSYAIERSAIINTAFNGRGTPLWGIAVPEGTMGWSEAAANHFSHDPEKAKALLAEAGYPDGFEARLLSTAQYGFHQNTAIAVQAELAKIGIKLTLDLPDWAGRMAKNTAGDYDVLVAGTAGDITDPDWLSNFFYGGETLVRLNNSAWFNDAEINALLDEGRTTLDPAKRAEVYDRFVQRALETSPFVFLMWRDQSFAVRDTVEGFKNLPGFLTFQSGITVEDVVLK